MRGREKAPLHKVRLATPIIRDGQGERGREREAADWMGWMGGCEQIEIDRNGT